MYITNTNTDSPIPVTRQNKCKPHFAISHVQRYELSILSGHASAWWRANLKTIFLIAVFLVNLHLSLHLTLYHVIPLARLPFQMSSPPLYRADGTLSSRRSVIMMTLAIARQFTSRCLLERKSSRPYGS